MTVNPTARRVAYTANGATASFAVPFQFFEIEVYLNGVLKTAGVHYNITQSSPGTTGTVVFVAPPAASDSVVVISATVQAQLIDLVDNDSAPAETYEKALDRLTMAIQDQVLISSQAVRGARYAAPQPELDFDGNPNAFLMTGVNGQLVFLDTGDATFPFSDLLASAVSSAQASAVASGLARDGSVIAQGDAEDAYSSTNALYVNFNIRYLGTQASAPTLDGSGNPVAQGALYFDSVLQSMRVYTGGGWAAVSGGGGGSGTVTSVATGTGLTGGPISSAGTISMADMPANTLKGNNTGATAAPANLTAAQIKTMLGIAAADVSGLAAIATSGSATNLSAGTVPAARMPALTGDVTTVAGGVATTIATNAVDNTQLADMSTSRIKGRVTAGTGDPQDLTGAQVVTLLPNATTAADGLMSAADKTKLDGVASVVGVLTSNALVVNVAENFPGSGDGSVFGYNRSTTGSLEISRDGTNWTTLIGAGGSATGGQIWVGNGRCCLTQFGAPLVNVPITGTGTVRFRFGTGGTLTITQMF